MKRKSQSSDMSYWFGCVDIGKGVLALWMRESFGSGVKLRRHAEPASFSFMALLHDLILYFNIYRFAHFVVFSLF